jgi:hypothetical protein
MKSNPIAMIACVLLVGLIPATAIGETVGSVALNLPPPAGFCSLTQDNASDRRAITTISAGLEKVGLKLLAISADCQELAGWRAGRRLLDHYAQYQGPLANLSVGSSIQKACADLRAVGGRFDSDQTAKSAVESVVPTVKLNEQKFIGVIAEDADACYAALVTKWRTELGTDKTQLTLTAVTILKGMPVNVHQYSVYDSAALDQELAKLKSTVAALYAANR